MQPHPWIAGTYGGTASCLWGLEQTWWWSMYVPTYLSYMARYEKVVGAGLYWRAGRFGLYFRWICRPEFFPLTTYELSMIDLSCAWDCLVVASYSNLRPRWWLIKAPANQTRDTIPLQAQCFTSSNEVALINKNFNAAYDVILVIVFLFFFSSQAESTYTAETHLAADNASTGSYYEHRTWPWYRGYRYLIAAHQR